MYNSNFKQQLWHYNYTVDVHCDKHVRVLIKKHAHLPCKSGF